MPIMVEKFGVMYSAADLIWPSLYLTLKARFKDFTRWGAFNSSDRLYWSIIQSYLKGMIKCSLDCLPWSWFK